MDTLSSPRSRSIRPIQGELLTPSAAANALVWLDTPPIGEPVARVRRNGVRGDMLLVPTAYDVYVLPKSTQTVLRMERLDVSRFDGAACRELRAERGCGKPKKGTKAHDERLARLAAIAANPTPIKPYNQRARGVHGLLRAARDHVAAK